MELRNRVSSQKVPPATAFTNPHTSNDSLSSSTTASTSATSNSTTTHENKHHPSLHSHVHSSIPSNTSFKYWYRPRNLNLIDPTTKARLKKCISFTRGCCTVYRRKLMLQHQHLKLISMFFMSTLLLRYNFGPPSSTISSSSTWTSSLEIRTRRDSAHSNLYHPYAGNIPIQIQSIPAITSESAQHHFILDDRRKLQEQGKSHSHPTPDHGGLHLTFLAHEACLHHVENNPNSKRTTGNYKNQTSLFDTSDTTTCPKGSFYAGRQIEYDPEAMNGHVYSKGEYEDYFMIDYYAFDDDDIRARPFPRWYKKHRGQYGRNEKIGHCRRTSWHRMSHQNCNSLHELDVIKERAKFLSYGSYRDVFKYNEKYYTPDTDHEYSKEEDEAVMIEVSQDLILKTSRTVQPFTFETYEFIRNDALVMERLTPSPRITDMYAYCGTSLITESLPYEVEDALVPGNGHIPKSDLKDKEDVDIQNEIPVGDKLGIALIMSEAMADLHGFKDGVIVHDDIQPAQFLWNEDGVMKLNDFNRAEVMLYDEDNGKYCKYKNGRGGGDYRAPEEYADWPLDEKIDVFSMGNNMYALLTGLWPFYDASYKEIAKKVKDGEIPDVDPRYKTRSFEEGVLVDLMHKCWKFDPDERIDIFEVVRTLREAMKEVDRRKEQKR